MKDIRYATRSLIKHPTYALVAVVTIALGIGSVTAIYSVVDAVLLQDLPYEAPEELVRIVVHEHGAWSRERIYVPAGYRGHRSA